MKSGTVQRRSCFSYKTAEQFTVGAVLFGPPRRLFSGRNGDVVPENIKGAGYKKTSQEKEVKKPGRPLIALRRAIR
jgi:hypothetical protein